ncbi:MAG: transposase [Proteobacteria bacterium SG_bin5]|nr:MAG: transposase [Proteobacteria bacterium SG_bin5]
MPEIKLARLPDRTPVKLAITVTPELHKALTDYATLYNRTYAQSEPITELIPHMLSAFLASDRAFAKARETLEGV